MIITDAGTVLLDEVLALMLLSGGTGDHRYCGLRNTHTLAGRRDWPHTQEDSRYTAGRRGVPMK